MIPNARVARIERMRIGTVAVNLASVFLRWFIYCYFSSLKTAILLPNGQRRLPRDYRFNSKVLAHSERDDLALVRLTFESSFITLVAEGRDGNWATLVLESIGGRVVRGSARRYGLEAHTKLVGELRASNLPAVICVDGPLGPQGVAKPGILWCARETGRTLIPLGTAARPRLVFRNTWSGIFLPLPFARVVIALSGPIVVSAETPDAEFPKILARVNREMEESRIRAEKLLSGERPEETGAV